MDTDSARLRISFLGILCSGHQFWVTNCMKQLAIAFVVCLVVGAAINGFRGAGGDAAMPPPEAPPITEDQAAPTSQVPEATDNSFDDDVLKAELPVLVDFGAEWCGPCKQMAPIVDKLASEYEGRVKFYKVDADRSPSVTARFNVNALPTVILFKSGKRGESFTGVVPQGDLITSLNKALD